MNFNKVIIAGNLTRDPELRYTPKGAAVASFGVAINRAWKSESGEQKEEVTFVDVTAFGRTAEICAQYQKKGDPTLIEGRLQLDQWDDKQTGQKRQKLKVVVESVQLCGPKRAGGSAPSPGAPPPRGQAGAEAAQPDAEDDVPF